MNLFLMAVILDTYGRHADGMQMPDGVTPRPYDSLGLPAASEPGRHREENPGGTPWSELRESLRLTAAA
jgi:hypothetical protein